MLRRGFLCCLLALSGCANQTVVQGCRLPHPAKSIFRGVGPIAVRYNGQADSGNFPGNMHCLPIA